MGPSMTAARPAEAEVKAPNDITDRQLRRLILGEAARALRTLFLLLLALAVVEWGVTGWLEGSMQQGLPAKPGPPRAGGVVAILAIPRLGVRQRVVEGVGRAALRRGPGHVPGSALPGQPGASVIAGHSSVFGGSFGRIAQLVVGDAIDVTPPGGPPVHYRVLAPAQPVGRVRIAPGATEVVLITGTPRFAPSAAIAVVAGPEGLSVPAQVPGGIGTVPLTRVVNDAALLRPNRLAQVLSVSLGLALVALWEGSRVARRRHVPGVLAAAALVGAAWFAALSVAVALACPAVF
jgi:sortase A